MDEPGNSAAHTKRLHSPDTVSALGSMSHKRTRPAGLKKVKKREWALIHQLRAERVKEGKDTVVIVDGFKYDWKSMQRNILRATAGQSALEPLFELPSHIELRSPSPELDSYSRPDFIEANPNLESSLQQSGEFSISMSPQSSDSTSERQNDKPTSEDHMETSGNAFLRQLPLLQIWGEFLGVRQLRRTWATLGSLGCVETRPEDSVGTFVDRLYDSATPQRHMSPLELILMLIREGCFSTSFFLEAVVLNLNGRDKEILDWVAEEIGIRDVSQFGMRALGAAAYRNNFEAVDRLLYSVDINRSISGPHYCRKCRCQISVITYAQIPRFHGEEPCASDGMIAYLLARGAAKSAGSDMGLLGLLDCVLRQQDLEPGSLLTQVQSIVPRIRKFADIVCDTGSVLETCLLETEHDSERSKTRLQVFEYLLDEGANTSSSSPLAALTLKGGPTLMGGPPELVEKLLANSENPPAKNKVINAYCNSVSLKTRCVRPALKRQPYNFIQSVSPIQAAALIGDEKAIRLYLEKGADANCSARGTSGVTPLQAICFFEGFWRETKVKIVNLLLDKGADVNAAPAWNFGLSALQAACCVKDIQIARLLVSRGADVNAPACKYGGGTALTLAARASAAGEGKLEMVRFLLEKGAAIPAAGVQSSSMFFNRHVVCDDNKVVLDFLRAYAPELVVRAGANGIASRDYREYEAQWKDDPTYESIG